MRILVTGGAGYIGSHAVQRLLRDGHTVVAFDNLFRGHTRAMDLLAANLPDRNASKRLTFAHGDICDQQLLQSLLDAHSIDAVMHFAALAYVGESVDDPLRYYRANVQGLWATLAACAAARSPVTKFVFSSSCSVYGTPPEGRVQVDESVPFNPVSPYGRTKLIGEMLLNDFAEARARAGQPFGFVALRYFNVCGCDRSGLIGEDHTPETHLIPVILQAALGQRDHVGIFGTDYPTPDGTCVRDYVHVEDLIDAHVLALQRLGAADRLAYNVGIGKGYSVREIIDAVRRVTGATLTVKEQPRRAGDPPAVFNNPAKITRELGWNAKVTNLDDIIASAWNWAKANPRGYAGGPR
jgi:UDP-glucose-4-epimerase GalE